MPKFPKNKGYKSPVKHTAKGKGNHLNSQTHGDISFHHHKNLGGGRYKDNWKVVMEQEASKGFTDKPDKKQIEALKKPTATAYAPFKMKHADGNPMKANFKSAFQVHDGKKFEDAGFMDTHFPSGKPRTPAKQLDDKEKEKNGKALVAYKPNKKVKVKSKSAELTRLKGGQSNVPKQLLEARAFEPAKGVKRNRRGKPKRKQ